VLQLDVDARGELSAQRVGTLPVPTEAPNAG
jgi:hypothetical protein